MKVSEQLVTYALFVLSMLIGMVFVCVAFVAGIRYEQMRTVTHDVVRVADSVLVSVEKLEQAHHDLICSTGVC